MENSVFYAIIYVDMKKQRIVVALGGNALGKTAEEQSQIVKKTVRPLVDLVEGGSQVLITHGNGPQVGMINLAFESASEETMPFPECGAMSQGYIGYHLQSALQAEIQRRGLSVPVATVIDKDFASAKLAETIKEYIKAGHFAAGSMLPKVMAGLHFVEPDEGRQALITSLANAKSGLAGEGGTRIYCRS